MAYNEVPMDRSRLDSLFDELDDLYFSKFGPKGPRHKLDLIIVGGAAIITKFGHRSTFDIDALTTNLPSKLTEASDAIATKYGMENDWLNNVVSRGDSHVRSYDVWPYRTGRAIRYLFPSDEILLVMKIDARRPTDLADAILLAVSTGNTTYDAMFDLSYQKRGGVHMAKPKRDFAQEVADIISALRGTGRSDSNILSMSAAALSAYFPKTDAG